MILSKMSVLIKARIHVKGVSLVTKKLCSFNCVGCARDNLGKDICDVILGRHFA